MLTKQVSNSDLMALLTGGAKSSEGAQGASDTALGEFSQILKGEGSLAGISPEALMNLFKKQTQNGATEAQALEGLMQQLGSGEGQELLKSLSFTDGKFVTAEGEALSAEALMKKLAQENSSSESVSKIDPRLEGFRPSKQAVQKHVAQKSMPVKSAEDFLAQRNALNGKSQVVMTKNGPQLKTTSPGLSRYRKESIVTDKKIIKTNHINGMDPQVESKSDFNMTEVYEGSGENQFELSSLKMRQDSNGTDMKMASKAQVIDLSNISANNKTELINKVSNYIEQAYVAGQDAVDMVVKHDELGQFRVSATRTGVSGQIDLQINTMTEIGHQFFVENESELIKSLTKNGVKLSDVKLVAGNEFLAMTDTNASGGESSSQQNGRSQQNSSQSQSSGSNSQQEAGQERRRQLWQDAREQYQNFQAA